LQQSSLVEKSVTATRNDKAMTAMWATARKNSKMTINCWYGKSTSRSSGIFNVLTVKNSNQPSGK